MRCKHWNVARPLMTRGDGCVHTRHHWPDLIEGHSATRSSISKPCLDRRLSEHFRIDDQVRHATMQEVARSLERAFRPTDEGTRPVADGMWREDDVIECEQWLVAATGSSANTSSAAPAMRPRRSASYSARSSTIPPRAVLIRNAVAFISPNARAPTRLRVLSFNGQLTTRKSDCVSTVSRSQSVTPNAATSVTLAYGSWAMWRISSGRMRRNSSRPIFPTPIEPRVRPVSPVPTYRIRSPQRAARVIGPWWDACASARM